MQLTQSDLDYIDALYRKHALMLFRYSKVIFKNPSIAEETVQETFIISCMHLEKIKTSPNPDGWLVNTHKNVCRNMKRTYFQYTKHILSLDEQLMQNESMDDTHSIDNSIYCPIPYDDFFILKKIILEGYSHKDIAKELGISVDASKKRFQRAKSRFKETYQEINN